MHFSAFSFSSRLIIDHFTALLLKFATRFNKFCEVEKQKYLELNWLWHSLMSNFQNNERKSLETDEFLLLKDILVFFLAEINWTHSTMQKKNITDCKIENFTKYTYYYYSQHWNVVTRK